MNAITNDKLSMDAFYSNKYVKVVEWEDLVLFHYTNTCVYDRMWDEVTLNARGIIYNRETGELVARPWQKFFNLDEASHVKLGSLNNESFYVLEKLDGSLGILFFYNNQFYITTKGSFTSTQAVWGTKWAREHINFLKIHNNFTYLFEIIYPQNKIVVDYGDRAELVLTGMVNKKTGQELELALLETHARALNVTCVKGFYFKSLEELAKYCKILPATHEGFVVTFPTTGFKLKVKGDEYLRIHKIISNLTPLAFWEAWDAKDKKIPEMYIQQVPEEFRDFTNEMSGIINKIHQDLYDKVHNEYEEILMVWNQKNPDKSYWTIKDFAIECQESHRVNISLLINLFKNQKEKMWENIHKRVRPASNILPEGYHTKCDIYGRINRVLDDL